MTMKKFLAQKMQKWAPWLLVRLYKLLVGVLMSTCRLKVRGLQEFIQAAASGKCALILWHDKLGLVAAILKKCAPELNYIAVVSNSRDGRILGQLATSYKQCDALFVPHNAREVALKQMVEILQEGKQVLIVTPDGPRGPRHCLKPGIALAAIHTGASVVPFSWSSSRFWHMTSTWDKMAFPKPFSTIDITFGSPLVFEPSTQINNAVDELQQSLTAHKLDMDNLD